MPAIEPLTPERWGDFAQLCARMGPNRSCWCVFWRRGSEAPRRPAKAWAQALVAEGERPIGLLAYDGDSAVGWVAVAARDEYPRLNEGRDTAPVGDPAGVWAVPCFFVLEGHRGQGVAGALLDAAVALAFAHGARAVEGVPVDPATRSRSPAASYTGTTAMFAARGFREVARRSPRGRVVMRLEAP
jgi:GNAT superfamily N-acetyltransferase